MAYVSFPKVGLWILLLPTAVALAGCSNSNQRETAPVSGTVTMDGKPLTGGYIVVAPGSGRMARGKIEPDGTFELTTYDRGDGCQLGTHPVTITSPSIDELSTPEEKAASVSIPEKYSRSATSGLTITVEDSSDNVVKLELTSK